MLDEYKSLNNNDSSMSPESAVIDKCFISCNETTIGWQSATNNIPLTQGDEITLEQVSFTVKMGQILAIIGQVGSGKVSVM